jgi:L-lactate permease
MPGRFRFSSRTIEQLASVVPLVLFVLTLAGLRRYAVVGEIVGLALAVAAGITCLGFVTATIHQHHRSLDRRQARQHG